jgi:hypothetical protein
MMNAVRRAKVEELKAQGLSPKAAYDEVKKLKLKGKRKC